MKLNKYSWLAILPMIFTACQEDMLVKEQQQDKIYTLTANMDGDAVMSRAQIQLGKTSSGEELFFWNENDEFDLYLNENTEPKIFMIEDGGGQKEATFTTTTPVPIDKDYVAVYPSGVPMEENAFEFNINNDLDFHSNGQTGTWEKYLQENMFMIAQGKFEYPDDAKVSFSHLCSMIRISYSNQTDQDMDINTISVSSESQNFSTWGNYSLDNGFSTTPENSCTLITDGLSVKAKTTADFYILFFPEEFSNEEDAVIRFEIGTDNWERDRDVLIDLAAIKEADANKDDTGFKAGKRYWFKVTETDKGLAWTNYTKTVEVDDITSFKEAMASPTVTHIALKNPIIVDGEDEVYFNPNAPKNVLMSDDFSWYVNAQEYDALIVNSCPRMELRNFRILGSDTESSTDKYLLKSTDGILYLDRMYLQADGNMNAVNLDNNKEFYLYGNTSSINVQNNGKYAFKVNSSTTSSTVYLDEGTIIGNVDYIDNYSTEESYGWFVLDRATLKGNVTVAGASVQYLALELREGATYTGNKTSEVSSFVELKQLEKNGFISEIKLKNPIIVDGEDEVYFNPNAPKNILMRDDFSWYVNVQEHDALIVNSCPRMELRNCRILGSDTESSTDKYLLKSTDGILYLDRMYLQADGNMNAVNLDNNKEFYLYGNTSSINVQNNGKYAFKVNSSTTSSTVYLDEGTIIGNVDYIDNYSTEESYGWFVLDRATLKGNVTVAGASVQYLALELREGATYTGNKTSEVSSFVELKQLEKNGFISEIKLKNPIIVDGEDEVYFNPNAPKNILMRDDFVWIVNGAEYDALFVNNGEWLALYNCSIQGSCEETESGKYMLETSTGSLFFSDGTLDANGGMNGVKVQDSWFSLMNESVIDVESNERVALNISSSPDAAADVHIQGTVNGDVTFVGNNASSNKPDRFSVEYNGVINGDLLATGTLDYWEVTFDASANVNGTGWDAWKTGNN